MELAAVIKSTSLALGLGLLVGLQREHAVSPLAGIRTFPLITLLGAVCALLGKSFGGWVLAAGFAGLAALVVAGNLLSARAGQADPGLTTEVAILLMYGVGAYLVVGHASVAIAISGGIAVLLHWKGELHGLVAKIGAKDFHALTRFVLVSLVVLPVLPNQYYGPYRVLNPFKIWLVAVLIVGLGLAGSLVYRVYGQKAGALVSALLGGLISSTATTVSQARTAAKSPQATGLATFVIVVATAVSFVRVLVLIAASAPDLIRQAPGPFMSMLGLFVLLAGVSALGLRQQSAHASPPEHSSNLGAALAFAALFAIVLLAGAAARAHFGQGGVYVVASLSGLTDMDAITLSMAQMHKNEGLLANTAWRAIILATVANLVFKTGVVMVSGSAALRLSIGAFFGVAALGGILMMILWPAGQD